MPVSGMRRVTPPTMINACSTMMEFEAHGGGVSTSDFARAAVTMPRMAKHKYSSSTPAAPSRPVSSAMTGKMKSLSATRMPPLGCGLTAHAPADAGARWVAVGDGIQALPAGSRRPGPRRRGPAKWRRGSAAHHAVKGPAAAASPMDTGWRLLPRGHIQHDDEHGKQHQGEAEVFLQHDDDEGERPPRPMRGRRVARLGSLAALPST